MNRFVTGATLLFACVPLVAAAQDSRHHTGETDRSISLGELTPTPEMWFYQQEQRTYHDPKIAVRKKAEFKSQQRQMRLAAQAWYGVSNARPTATSTPFAGGTYAPAFGGSRDPNRWPGQSTSTTLFLRPQRY